MCTEFPDPGLPSPLTTNIIVANISVNKMSRKIRCLTYQNKSRSYIIGNKTRRDRTKYLNEINARMGGASEASPEGNPEERRRPYQNNHTSPPHLHMTEERENIKFRLITIKERNQTIKEKGNNNVCKIPY